MKYLCANQLFETCKHVWKTFLVEINNPMPAVLTASDLRGLPPNWASAIWGAVYNIELMCDTSRVCWTQTICHTFLCFAALCQSWTSCVAILLLGSVMLLVYPQFSVSAMPLKRPSMPPKRLETTSHGPTLYLHTIGSTSLTGCNGFFFFLSNVWYLPLNVIPKART